MPTRMTRLVPEAFSLSEWHDQQLKRFGLYVQWHRETGLYGLRRTINNTVVYSAFYPSQLRIFIEGYEAHAHAVGDFVIDGVLEDIAS